jgi:chromosome segregation ATPase
MSQRQRKAAAPSVDPAKKVRADQVEVDELRALREELDERASQLNALRAELDALRRAHDEQSRHLISERLAVAENAAALLGEIEELKADVEWRKSVMTTYEEQLETLRNSRSMRYTASVRRLADAVRSRRT